MKNSLHLLMVAAALSVSVVWAAPREAPELQYEWRGHSFSVTKIKRGFVLTPLQQQVVLQPEPKIREKACQAFYQRLEGIRGIVQLCKDYDELLTRPCKDQNRTYFKSARLGIIDTDFFRGAPQAWNVMEIIGPQFDPNEILELRRAFAKARRLPLHRVRLAAQLELSQVGLQEVSVEFQAHSTDSATTFTRESLQIEPELPRISVIENPQTGAPIATIRTEGLENLCDLATGRATLELRVGVRGALAPSTLEASQARVMWEGYQAVKSTYGRKSSPGVFELVMAGYRLARLFPAESEDTVLDLFESYHSLEDLELLEFKNQSELMRELYPSDVDLTNVMIRASREGGAL